MYLYLGTRNCLPFASTCLFCEVRVAHLFRFMCCVFYLFVFVLTLVPNVTRVSGMSIRFSLTFIKVLL